MNRRVSDFCPFCDKDWSTCTCRCPVCGVGPCICELEEAEDATPTTDETEPFLPGEEDGTPAYLTY